MYLSRRYMGFNILPNLTRIFAASSVKPSSSAVSSSDQAMSDIKPGSLDRAESEWRAVLSREQVDPPLYSVMEAYNLILNAVQGVEREGN
jgi:hypothetical protein